MNKLELVNISDYFYPFFQEERDNFYFIIPNNIYKDELDNLKNFDFRKIFEDFNMETQEISPILIHVGDFEGFLMVYNLLIKKNCLNLIQSDYDFDVVFDEIKNKLDLKITGLGNYLFRFYDNYIFDFTNLVIDEKRQFNLLGRYIKSWYWNDLNTNVKYIEKKEIVYMDLEKFKLNEIEFNKINELIYPFSLKLKFEEYKEFGNLQVNLKTDKDWYEEIVHRLEKARIRGLSRQDDVKLYALLSFGLGDEIFDGNPFNKALEKVLVNNRTLENALNEINLNELREEI